MADWNHLYSWETLKNWRHAKFGDKMKDDNYIKNLSTDTHK